MDLLAGREVLDPHPAVALHDARAVLHDRQALAVDHDLIEGVVAGAHEEHVPVGGGQGGRRDGRVVAASGGVVIDARRLSRCGGVSERNKGSRLKNKRPR